MEISEILAVNGQSDEQEPWTAADDCEIIEINGADMLALADDGVAWWINNDRCWIEVRPSNLSRVIDHLRGTRNDAKIEKLQGWMATIWE